MADTLQRSRVLAEFTASVLPVSTEISVEACAVCKTYPGNIRALNLLSFCIRRGSIFALLGPNGAGKSTIVKIFTTLSQPDSGEAKVTGLDVTHYPHLVRNLIGCVPQHSTVDLDSTGRENLTLQGRLYGLRGSSLKNTVSSLLDRLGLSESADRIGREYSGGMQRKLDIALGLVHHPEILFLDEPTTGLDPKARNDLWKEIQQLSQQGMTILLTTHYLEEADRLAQRVAIMERGQVVVEGPPEELKARLRGDSIRIEFASPFPQSRVESALERISGLRELHIESDVLHLRADDGAGMAPTVLLALQSENIRIASVKIAGPSLDDVYLRYTGRTLSKAESDGRS
jgi:ABC-2 type transport system ATP-binding protein